MKAYFLILFISFSAFCINLSAQKIPRKLISVSGSSYSDNHTYISWSIGEAVTNFTSKEGYTITQGFQQPSLMLKESVVLPEIDEVRVYPNPVVDILTLKFDVKYIRSYRIEISSIQGRTLLVRDLEFSESLYWHEKIDLSSFSNGLYFVYVFCNERRINRVFRIVKISGRQ